MDTILTQQQAGEVAGAYFDRIALVIDAAFQDYLTCLKGINSLGIKTNLKARTSASLIHDFIQIKAREEFVNEMDVKVDEFNGMFGLLICKKIFVRFKKLSPDLKASNVKTDQVNQFNKQQLELPGFERLTLLTAGYIPDLTWTAIQSTTLTCKREDEVIWHRDFHSQTTQTSMFGVNYGAEEKLTTGDEPIVRIKESRREQTGTGS